MDIAGCFDIMSSFFSPETEEEDSASPINMAKTEPIATVSKAPETVEKHSDLPTIPLLPPAGIACLVILYPGASMVLTTDLTSAIGYVTTSKVTLVDMGIPTAMLSVHHVMVGS